MAVLHTIAVAAQPMLAGAYLSGEVDAIDLHRGNALSVVFYLAAALVVAAVLNWRPGGGRGWPALAAAGLLSAETLQIVVGFERQLAVHIPLGVAIVTLSVLFTLSVLRLGPRRSHMEEVGRT